MKKTVVFCLTVFILLNPLAVRAQSLFVDPLKGHKRASGTVNDPLNSLDSAIAIAAKFTGEEPVKIKLAMGLYTITRPLVITRYNKKVDTANYSIEAITMPDDTAWHPAKMPVIQCIADSNRVGKLRHASSAFLINRGHVSIKGLKFIGNPNPASQYYYAIERKDSTLTSLEISQCYFIGDKNASPMQGGVLAQGAGIHVDHCVFYGVKNAVMAFLGVKDFSLTHTIIYDAYEGAVWYGYGQSSSMPFTFSNNIVARSKYIFVGYKGIHTSYAFNNSLFSENVHYMGFNNNTIEPDLKNRPKETNLRKSGKVILNEVTDQGIPRDYLNLSPGSAGKDLSVGIFKK